MSLVLVKGLCDENRIAKEDKVVHCLQISLALVPFSQNLASDLAFDVGHYTCPQRDDRESLWISRVRKVGPGLLFRLALDAQDERFMVRLSDLEENLAFSHTEPNKAAISSIGGHGARRCGEENDGEKQSGDWHGVIL